MNCKRCHSYAINHHLHGRDGSGKDLCDVCYWRNIAEKHDNNTCSCGVRFNDCSSRTKECRTRNLESANDRIKRLEEAGDELASWSPSITHSSNWRKAKEAKL